MQPQTHGYRIAVSLNNTAVALLERGCLRQGLDTLQDSIIILKEAFRPQDGVIPDATDTLWKLDAVKRLHRAAQRSAVPESLNISNLQIHSLSYDVGLTPVLKHLHESPSMTCFFPIRIDVPVEWTHSPCLADADYESAIILYNFGVATSLLSKAAPPAISDRLRASALGVFHLASSVLSKLSNLCEDRMEEVDLLQLALVVFHATIQVFVEAGSDHEASVVFERYHCIRQVVSTLKNCDWLECSKSVAPAA